MNSISNISILPEINSTSIWHTLVDNVLNGIAYLFAAILSTRARKIETAPVGVLQNTSAIETVLDIYGEPQRKQHPVRSETRQRSLKTSIKGGV